jgi:adenosylhomocysteine nucleosidase
MSHTGHPPPETAYAAAIVFALPVEADAFEALATRRTTIRAAHATIHEGLIADRRVAWCVAGMGRQAAATATRLLIAGHRPRIVVSAGFVGALDPNLRRGDLVVPTVAITEGDARPIPLVPYGPVGGAAGESTATAIVTVDRVVATAAAKADLAAATAARLVDMETHAVATAAHEAGLPCASVRVVSDTADENLPPEVASLAAPQSAARRLGRALGAIGRRPRAAFDLWRVWEHAVVDGRTLAAALVAGLRDAT